MTVPPDDLVISGGGRFAVVPEDVLAYRSVVADFGEVVERCLDRARSESVASQPGALVGAASPVEIAAAESIASALDALRRARAIAWVVSDGLAIAGERYAAVEHAVHHLADVAESWLAARLGAAASILALLSLPAVGGVALGLLASRELLPRAPDGATLAHRELLTDPVTVMLIRRLVSRGDEFALGFAGVPADRAVLLGDEVLGVVGVSTTAATATALVAPLGVLAETPVRAEVRSRQGDRAPARGFADRVSRIPSGVEQIVVERYSSSSGPDRFEVYLGGTIDPSPRARGEPWDMTSNVHAVAGLSAGSERAVVEALAAAGVTAESPVTFTGYSQGGLIAARLAASGDYATAGLLTIGAPAAHIEPTRAYPAIAIEHVDDLVPALAGERRDVSTLVVTREAFAGRDIGGDHPLPAHDIAAYRETARRMDASIARELEAPCAALDGFAASAAGPGVALGFHAVRSPADANAPVSGDAPAGAGRSR